ncbi:MAG: transaldolase [Bryobacterales bacterium]|nr:transaldolase [Bryobacteraceae bacterium]MDW8353666.1 transaldolase [Bryobacterales bacterium]
MSGVPSHSAGLTLHLGEHLPRLERRLGAWEAAGFAARLWGKDPTLWGLDPQATEIADRLGWLQLPETARRLAPEWSTFAAEIRAEGFHQVVLLGMGGSSLAPEVFQRTFGHTAGSPELIVLDSTHPEAVRAVERRLDLPRTLFLVASKSGTTVEPLALFRYFWHRACQEGRRFAAITDPGTPLEQMAAEHGFRRVLLAPSDVGGRYSALSDFGLAPAALIGLDLSKLIASSRAMAEACRPDVPAAQNPGLVLGAALGELARAGRDKLTFFTSPSLESIPDWIEQLVAESSGKDGRGIVPVAAEPEGFPEAYGPDRVFVWLGLEREAEPSLVEALARAGQPVLRLRLAGLEQLGGEFFRWEFATAAACAVLGVHPFNQPDVQLAKELARRAMQKGGVADSPEVLAADDIQRLRPALRELLEPASPPRYLALQAYLAPSRETTQTLNRIRGLLRDRLRVATTAGYGPRFLHSTGQLHKGGPDTGLFLQLVDEPAEDLEVPGSNYTFGQLLRAQADGDAAALRRRGRPLVRVNVGPDAAAGLRRLIELLAADPRR